VFGQLPPVTRTLIIANVAVFLAQMVIGEPLIMNFALWPLASATTAEAFSGYPHFQPWQIISYSFLHGGWMHLFFNMFALYMFGGELERLFGNKRFFNLYFAGVVTAALAQLMVSSMAGANPYPTIGASGGVFGLLLAFGMYFPKRIIVLLIPPIPMPAWLFVTLYGCVELFLGVTGTMEGVAHFAHLGGMLGAWLLIRYWRGGTPFGRR
jgi:membrane associated rhomboid family serine protease